MTPTSQMDWNKLMSMQAIGCERGLNANSQRDYNRIVFSSAFRRLTNKTQVYPLSTNDYVRTRLTHTLEVSCVGRNLGQIVQKELLGKDAIPKDLPDFGEVVAAACLAHDIGNPPFGHSGESAIQQWAKRHVSLKPVGKSNDTSSPIKWVVDTEQQLLDLHNFEGNAQGFRVLSKIQHHPRSGGLRLSYATVGTMLKYPRPSHTEKIAGRCELKKHGYFENDQDLIRPVLDNLGDNDHCNGAFRRHPLAFLVEAADDICNRLIDLEDSVDQKVISQSDALNAIKSLIACLDPKADLSIHPEVESYRFQAIILMIIECARVFVDNLATIEVGTFGTPLVEESRAKEAYKNIENLVEKHAYRDSRVLQVELAGFRVIGGLLDIFADALCVRMPDGEQSKVRKLFPKSYMKTHRINWHGDEDPADDLSSLGNYQKILFATDYISGMTDRFAVDLFQKLTGIHLPD